MYQCLVKRIIKCDNVRCNHNFEKDGNVITCNDIIAFIQHHQEYNYDANDDESEATAATLQHYLKLHPLSDNPNLTRLAKLAVSGFWTTSSNYHSLVL